MPDNYSSRQVAVHEAGHFIFCCAQNLGVPELITVEPTVVGSTMSDQVNPLPKGTEALGFCARKLTAIEQLLNAEIAGRELEAFTKNLYGPTLAPLMSPQVIADSLARYRSVRTEWAQKLILMHVAGTAADAKLSGGSGKIPAGDFEPASALARLIAPNGQAEKLVEEKYREACHDSAGKFKKAIEAAADRLEASKTLRETELKTLWGQLLSVIPA